jgi:hypothetical protein
VSKARGQERGQDRGPHGYWSWATLWLRRSALYLELCCRV